MHCRNLCLTGPETETGSLILMTPHVDQTVNISAKTEITQSFTIENSYITISERESKVHPVASFSFPFEQPFGICSMQFLAPVLVPHQGELQVTSQVCISYEVHMPCESTKHGAFSNFAAAFFFLGKKYFSWKRVKAYDRLPQPTMAQKIHHLHNHSGTHAPPLSSKMADRKLRKLL